MASVLSCWATFVVVMFSMISLSWCVIIVGCVPPLSGAMDRPIQCRGDGRESPQVTLVSGNDVFHAMPRKKTGFDDIDRQMRERKMMAMLVRAGLSRECRERSRIDFIKIEATFVA
jgi:hypothetical protein